MAHGRHFIERDPIIDYADQGRTSAEGGWAAGDCTRLPFNGRLVRLENVQNAIDRAVVVARDMLGQPMPGWREVEVGRG